MKIISISIPLFFLLAVNIHGQKSKIDLSTTSNFNIEKYLGKWYEIARYDHRFEKNLQGVTTHYSMLDNGKLKVINKGLKKTLDGKRTEAIGKGIIPDPSDPAKFKVAFFANFYADYYVFEVEKNYQWALVGSSTPDFLWILSRTPKMDKTLYQDLINKLARRGFDVSKLVKVKH